MVLIYMRTTIRNKIRIFCYHNNWYWLFIKLSNKKELKELRDGLEYVERLRSKQW